MVAQKGKDLLLKISDGASYVTVAGLRSRRLAFNAETVDVTDAESAGRWRRRQCARRSRPLKVSTGTMRARLTARIELARRSQTAPASPGFFVQRISSAGGRTGITTAWAGWRRWSPRHGFRA
nr:phage major tail protein, TP901-1 family [Neorhizobium xiangyangii]